jgi:hypothetical protein
MANYPEWVMKYKEKGTYINYVKGKYYLYTAHSERVAGTKKVKRICDAYLGRITEEAGLIPPRDKVAGTVAVFEFGLSALILTVCDNIYKGLRRAFTKNGDFVMVAAILSFMYGKYNDCFYRYSYLSITFPELDFKTQPTEAQVSGIDRSLRMIKDTMLRTFGEDLQAVILHFGHLYKVNVNEKLYLSEESNEIKRFKQKYSIKLEVENG